jgi:hypothetical protein
MASESHPSLSSALEEKAEGEALDATRHGEATRNLKRFCEAESWGRTMPYRR